MSEPWDPDFLARSPMLEPLRALGGVLDRKSVV